MTKEGQSADQPQGQGPGQAKGAGIGQGQEQVEGDQHHLSQEPPLPLAIGPPSRQLKVQPRRAAGS